MVKDILASIQFEDSEWKPSLKDVADVEAVFMQIVNIDNIFRMEDY